MLIDPISGMRMVRAKAAGGVFWYCRYSGSRLLTVVCAKKFLGEDGTREIWVRSGLSPQLSEHKCPSCTKPMRLVTKPGWIGEGGEIDVCRGCHFIWIKPDAHPEVPKPDDLIVPEGDSTLLRDAGDAAVAYAQKKDEIEKDEKNMIGEGPSSLGGQIVGFFRLPVEMSEHGRPVHTYVSWFFMLLMGLVYFKYREQFHFDLFGFYPSDPLKNSGLNIFTNAFLHAGAFHLLFNLYFFSMFSDDVEYDLGPVKFVFFFISALILTAFFNFLLARGDARAIPHVGMSGLIMALMAYYALQFPKGRIAYLVPVIHRFSFGAGAMAGLWGARWIRISAWWVFLVFVLKDFLFYKFAGSTGVSYSGHLGGALAGVILWGIFAKKADPRRDIEITGEREKVPYLGLKQ
jgi:membrane associated rhomboid family serine protease